MNPQVAAYIREILGRLFAKSPIFFHIYKMITGGLTFAGYLPAVLCNYFGVELPDHFVNLCRDIGIGATGAFATSFLPAESTQVGIQDSGDILHQTDEKRMPFTKMREDKQREKLQNENLVDEVVAIKEEETSEAKKDKTD